MTGNVCRSSYVALVSLRKFYQGEMYPTVPPTRPVCHDFCQLHFSKLILNFLIDEAIDSLLCNAVTENKHDKDLYTEKNEESNLNDVEKEDEVDVGEFDDIFSDSSESDNESLGQRLVNHL